MEFAGFLAHSNQNPWNFKTSKPFNAKKKITYKKPTNKFDAFELETRHEKIENFLSITVTFETP
jgi:hypothetical protein